MQPLEEQLRSQLVTMIQDCQDRVFTAYKSQRARSREFSIGVLQSTEKGSEKNLPNGGEMTLDIVSVAFESAPLQTQDQTGTDLRNVKNPGTQHDRPTFEENSFSDSAYATQLCSCFDGDYGNFFCTCPDLTYGDRMY
jgi:hypothetical protein